MCIRRARLYYYAMSCASLVHCVVPRARLALYHISKRVSGPKGASCGHSLADFCMPSLMCSNDSSPSLMWVQASGVLGYRRHESPPAQLYMLYEAMYVKVTRL